MNLVLVERDEIELRDDARVVTLRDHRAEHLRTVLRVARAARVRVGVVDGPVGSALVASVDDDAIVLELDDVNDDPTHAPPPSRLDVVLCLPRPKVLARLLSPLAQLGVHRVHLSGAWRVERFYFDATILDPAEQRPLLLEGLSQARDTRLPVVTVHRSFAWLVRTELGPASGDVLRLYADPGQRRSLHRAILDWPLRATGRVLLAIGPEGGFTDGERRELEAASFVGVGLGPRVLRSDVATIALLALAHDALGAEVR